MTRKINENLLLTSSIFIKQKDFWLGKLSGDIAETSLLMEEKPGPGIQKEVPFDILELEIPFPQHLSHAVIKLGKQAEIAIYIILLTVLESLIYRYTGNGDITVISPLYRVFVSDTTMNRSVFIRTRVSADTTFRELLFQTRQTVLDAYDHQDYPSGRLVETLLGDSPGENQPRRISNVLCRLKNIHVEGDPAEERDAIVFDFSLAGERLAGHILYHGDDNSDYYIKQVPGHFIALLNSAILDINGKISQVSFISEEEKRQLLDDFNGTEVAYPAEKTLHCLFTGQAQKTPDHIALVAQGAERKAHSEKRRPALCSMLYTLSYKELNEKSNQLAHLLKEKGVKPDTIVAIMVERSVEMIIGILGILKAGGAYLPIDPDYPEDRIKYILSDSSAKVLVTASDIIREAGKLGSWEAEKGASKPSDLAYVIYTSGSTGLPKGTMVEHRNVVGYVNTFLQEFQLTGSDTVIQQASLSFDAFVEEVYPILSRGGRIAIAQMMEIIDMKLLSEFIFKQRVTLISCTPLLLNELNSLEELKCITTFISGGEELKREHVDHLVKYATVYNTYGPTETTVCVTYYRCRDLSRWRIPIGKPITNYKVYIYDSNLNLVPPGIPGEICVSGIGVARGYLNRPELTAERFLSFCYKSYMSYSTYISQKMYRTGDLARWLPEGSIEFLGRIDQQVKIRGYRIELGEIEICLKNHARVKEAVVLEKEDQSGDKFLCAYYIPEPGLGDSLPISELRDHLVGNLPAYMVPSYFMQLEKIPLTPGGKVDRRMLPAPVVESGTTYAAPRNRTEESLTRLWARVLGIEPHRIGIDDNFFVLGGHSLKATVLAAEIHKEFNVKVPLREIFNTPTIREFVKTISTADQERFSAIEPVEKREYYQLSSAQKRLYILQQMELASTAYNMPQVIPLAQETDLDRLQETFTQLIRRHESLRTSFHMVEDEPVQRVHDEVQFEIEYYDSGRQGEREAGRQGNRATGNELFKDFIRPFDLAQAPLLRVGILENKETGNLLLVDMHHIISDGVSHEILEQDFMLLYRGEKLAPLRIQYKDFCMWQNSEGERDNIRQQEVYWLGRFKDEVPVLNLPFDYPRPVIQDFTGDTVVFHLGKEETRSLQNLALQQGTTLFMVLLGVYNVLLAKLSGQEDIVIGTPVVGRRHVHLEKIIGMFVNTLALRSQPTGNNTYREFLIEGKENTLEAFENQDYPFEDLVDRVSVQRDITRNPLFDVMLDLWNLDGDERNQRTGTGKTTAEPQPGESEPLNLGLQTAKFDLTLSARIDAGGKLAFGLNYNTGLFKKKTAQRFTRYFKNIILAIIKEPDSKISAVEILGKEEKRQLLYDYNNTRCEYPQDKTLHQLFANQVEKTPNHVALTGVHETHEKHRKNNNMSYLSYMSHISYKELNQKSHQLAHLLQTKGIQPDAIVGIMLERSIEMIVAILGILKAGGAYLPLDPEYPEERIDYMLKDSNVKILLTRQEIANLSSQEAFNNNPKGASFHLHLSPQVNAPVTSLAYIIYTSGSTGKPKGVRVTHQGVVNYLCWAAKQYIKGESVYFPLYTSLSFDLTVTSVFLPLITGNTLVIYRDSETGLLIERVIAENRVDIVKVTPAHLKVIKNHPLGHSRIKRLIVGGEELETSLAKDIYHAFNGNIEIYNEYGPTETVVGCMIHRYSPETDINSTVPIGKPADNVQIYLLDQYQKPVPMGVVGEIYISGHGVAKGYVKDEALSAEKFLENPFSPGQVMYKSGDLGKWNPDGLLEFLGRLDNQVKIRGYRLELGEIREQLLKLAEIKDALVISKKDKDGERYLCAYFVKNETGETGAGVIAVARKKLSENLPQYMLPLYFIELPEIPLTSNGKVDRKALPDPEMGVEEGYIAPRTDLEKRLAETWAEVLHMDKAAIGVQTNFFQLGGHSLRATILISKLHKVLNVRVPLVEIFKNPTIAGLATYIKEAAEERYLSIEPAEKMEYYALSSAQKRLYILQEMDLTSTAYNMPLVYPLGKDIREDKLELTIKELIARHESLRTSFHTVADEPVQKVHDEVEFEIEYYSSGRQASYDSGRQGNRETGSELSPKTPASLSASLPESSQRFPLSLSPSLPELFKDFIRPFDLTRAPLVRSGLIRLPDYYLWMVDIHHIVSDGTSNIIVTEDFMKLYQGMELEPLHLQYKDFSQWQNRLFESGEIKKQEDYWLKLFSGEIPLLRFPTDYKRPEVFNFKGGNYRFIIAPEEAVKFKALSFGSGDTGTIDTNRGMATLYMNILAALTTLLYKYTGQTDIIIGSVTDGRVHADLQDIMGMFVNTLAMRNYPHAEKTYEFFLEEVMKNTIEAIENQDVQFEELVDKLGLERDPARNPLFDISMVVQNFRRVGEGGTGSLDSRGWATIQQVEQNLPSIEFKNPTAKFDMTFFVMEVEDEIQIDIEYYTGIFKQETIQRLAAHFVNIIKAVSQDSTIKLKYIDIASQEEKKQVLYEFNDTCSWYPKDKPLHQLFREQVECNPDHTALVYENDTLTYKELNRGAHRLACYLYHKKGIKTGSIVGIWMNPSLNRLMAVLGIHKAGGAYVPIDPALPPERIKYMLRDASIRVVISEKGFVKDLNRLQWECEDFHSYLCLDSRDILGEEEQERNELMDVELWHHVGETSIDDITGGGWSSSYTGESFSREEMDEYGDNILKKLEPLLHPRTRVLEIGCASGITMYRIAPRVGLYYGTDLSEVIIEKNKKRLEKEGQQNIKLSPLAAHDIWQIDEKNFDLVIMNSVIQCFHGHNYLRKVIKKCIDLMADRGHLFIGDIMDLEKKDALVADLIGFKKANASSDKNYTTKTDFSAELFFSRAFWQDLAAELQEVESIEFSDKIHTIENELTKFRYDALITINKQRAGPEINKKYQKQKYQDDMNMLAALDPRSFSLEVPASSPAYIIYTSGTTGNPKGVIIQHASVVNLVQYQRNLFPVDETDRILQFSSISFDASVEQVFTALLSGAVLVLIDKEILLDMMYLEGFIISRCITHLHAVPSFLDNIPVGSIYPLRRMLSGGDVCPVALAMQWHNRCDFYNKYGPTETTVTSIEMPVQAIEKNLPRVPIGKPVANTFVYILDPWMSPVPISVPGELYIGGDGAARGYLNNPELTAEKFLTISNKSYMTYTTYISKKIYKTGDLVRWLPDGNIEFFGRIDQQVKIRGFRIELGDIENQLMKHDRVKKAVIIDREDETGEKYLCAYFVSGNPPDITELQQFLAVKLPPYMIPRYFVEIDGIPLTVSGKLDRKALPQPVIDREGYVPPGNEIEKRLAHIWQEVLGIPQPGITDNFFQLGGHSLRATILVSRIHKELKVKVPLVEVFKGPTIRNLAVYIARTEKKEFTAVEPAEKKEYYAVSSAQKRLYIAQQVEKGDLRYNMPWIKDLEGQFEKEKLENTFKKLLQRHESLRTSFHMPQGEIVQVIHENHEVKFAVEYYEANEDEAKEISAKFARVFDLSEAPLFRVGLIKLAALRFILMFDMHHIITDGISMEIFEKEFLALYRGKSLVSVRLQYKDYSEWQNRELQSGAIKKQEEYWLSLFSGEIPLLKMPTDFPRPPKIRFEGSVIHFGLDKKLITGIEELIARVDSSLSLYIVLLAVYNVLLSMYTGQDTILVGSPVSGRTHADLNEMIGLFINMLVMKNHPTPGKTFREFLLEVKENAVKAFENQDFPFDRLVEKLNIPSNPNRHPLIDTVFTLQQVERGEMQIEETQTTQTIQHELLLNAVAARDFISMSLEYSTILFKTSTVHDMTRHYVEILEQVTANNQVRLRDIKISHDLEPIALALQDDGEDFTF